MPELPDVEVFKQYLDSTSLHQKIGSVDVRNKKILGGVSARRLHDALEGRSFESTRRHGKHLFTQLDGESWLMLHFGMTGRLEYFKDADDEPRHSRLLVGFEGGYYLSFDCPRMFGRVDLVEAPESFVRAQKLGPDALGMDLTTFRECLEGRRGTIKSAMMNQRVLAGIGNIYSDEILFQARVHPETNAGQFDAETLENLFRKTGEVLRTAIEARADPGKLPDSYLLPRRREGEECPRCGGQVERIVVSGRGTYYCPACQTEG